MPCERKIVAQGRCPGGELRTGDERRGEPRSLPARYWGAMLKQYFIHESGLGRTRGAHLIPTTSAPAARKKRCSARVSYVGPATFNPS